MAKMLSSEISYQELKGNDMVATSIFYAVCEINM